jgi:hypothetical protein
MLTTNGPSPQPSLSAHVSRDTNVIKILLDFIALQFYYLWMGGAIGELSDAAPQYVLINIRFVGYYSTSTANRCRCVGRTGFL